MRRAGIAAATFALAALGGGAVAALDGCSSGDAGTLGGAASDAGRDGTTTTPPPPSGGDDGGASSDDGAAPTPQTVTFAYAPQWPGVKSVAVLGGFGQASDWTAPLATLSDDGHGTFRGTATLPPGSYAYVLRVVGDASAAAPDTFARYAIDPTNPAFTACPAQSPTYSKLVANPCSQLDVPQASTPATTFHVKGTVLDDGKPASGWIVEIEREEPQSHHFFANRITTGADGAFDLVAAAGTWRLQVDHPTLLAQTDAQRDPIALAAARRLISASFALSADREVTVPDVALHTYATYDPRGDAGALPTRFTFAIDGEPTRAAVYGTGMDGGGAEIGDPWFLSAPSDGGVDFDGSFDTKQANEPAVRAGERYFWGTESARAMDGGAWTRQSMVFPITWR